MFCLHRLNPNNPSIKHFVDIIYDVEPREVDTDNVSAIIRDKAWEELPNVLKLAERPTFAYLSQFFLIQQVDGKVCILKHYYIKEEKVKGAYVMRLIKGTGHEIAWSTQQAKSQAFYLKLLAHGICHETAKQQVRECFELARSEAKQVQISARRIRKRQSRENPQGSGWRALRRRKKESRKR